MRTIKIGDGRFLIVVTDPDNVVTQESLDLFQETILEWWESGNKFLIVDEFGKVSIRLERVEDKT